MTGERSVKVLKVAGQVGWRLGLLVVLTDLVTPRPNNLLMTYTTPIDRALARLAGRKRDAMGSA